MNDPKAVLSTIVGLIAENKRSAEALATRIRDAQKKRNLPLDTRADYAEGAAGAYSLTLSIIAGAAGVADPYQLIETGDGEIDTTDANPHFPVDHEYAGG